MIDFDAFEELFKTGSGLPVNPANVSPHLKQKFVKAPESLTLLDPQRQRNLGKKLNTDSKSSLQTSFDWLQMPMLLQSYNLIIKPRVTR